jgi:alkylation response protein AidB-like acyl-CoA dehydrogenase
VIFLKNKKGDVQCINDEILEKMQLSYRYKFLNNNLISLLLTEDYNFLRELQKFYINFENKNNITHKEDFYAWIPEIGKAGYLTRVNHFNDIGLNFQPYGMKAELLRIIATDFFDPQLTMAGGACVLAVNPILMHNEGVEIRLKALKELVLGEKIGCICITEPERGSDAVHMITTCEEQPDGSYLLNGEKIYQTNGPKADWAVVYACAEKDNGNTMGQFLVNTSWEGWKVDRINIPWVPRIYLGKERFNNLKVPKECVLGKPGLGREYLFEGLNLERLGGCILYVSEAWNAVTHAVIYANMRKQFDQEILKFQGVGFPLSDLWAKTMNLTLSLLYICGLVDQKMKENKGTLPKAFNLSLGAYVAQLKYQCAKLSERVCYQCANLMGGAGVCDNTLMQDLLGISRIQEIGAGTRQIQQYIMSYALRRLFKML